MKILNTDYLLVHENNSFSYSSSIVDHRQLYFTNYSYNEKPAFLGSYGDGLNKVLIVLDDSASIVEEILVSQISDLKLTNPELIPEFLFNYYFSNFNTGLIHEEKLIKYEVVPVYKYSQLAIVPLDSRIEVVPLDYRFTELLSLDNFDQFEKEIICNITKLDSNLVVFDVCRIINSYRRLKLNLISQTDKSDYFIHRW